MEIRHQPRRNVIEYIFIAITILEPFRNLMRVNATKRTISRFEGKLEKLKSHGFPIKSVMVMVNYKTIAEQ